MGFVARTLITAIAFLVAQALIPGIAIRGWGWLIIAAVVFGLVNAFIRPVIFLLSLPLTVLTLGLFTLVINAMMLGLTAWLIPGLEVRGFWAAFWGAVVIWIVSWIANSLVGDRG
ncbi:phage holin family protein [Roseomonas sp. CCTCC AB2023176]|uniref:phage holin family protein n=1 Tax=Roseomonas sp. CCTCC AB2023176 TaxID=3342640 RepID=UPI0035E1259F